jgi:hypothetical protein
VQPLQLAATACTPQVMQNVLAGAEVYLPQGQAVQLVCARKVWNRPLGHCAQRRWPSWPWYMPGSQESQTLWPGAELIFPFVHTEHKIAPERPYWPLAQSVQVVAWLPSERRPAGQFVQAHEMLVVSRYLPPGHESTDDGHRAHFDAPIGPNFPKWQRVQGLEVAAVSVEN